MSGPRAARLLAELLGQERDAAAAGDLDRLAALAPRKERLAREVEDALAAGAFAGDPETLRALGRALEASAPLVGAALEGVRSARSRLDARREAASRPLRTYGRDGAAGSIAPPPATVRRA